MHFTWSSLFNAATTTLVFASALHAQCLDWSTEFAPAGPSETVRAQIVFDDGGGDQLYVAGSATGSALDSIQRWNGAAWSSIPSHLVPAPSSNAWIEALAVFDDGSGPALFAAGRFAAIDGVAASNIARWNGSSWSALGSGLFRDVKALAVHDDGSGMKLYAGGAFYLNGNVSGSRVARWDGVSWSSVGTTMNGPAGVPVVETLLVYDDGSGPALLAGGQLDSADGLQVRNVARWNGTSWTGYGGGEQRYMLALCVYDDGSGPALYAGGMFDPFSPRFIAKLSGGGWVQQGGNIDGEIRDLRVFDDGAGAKLYVGGTIRSVGSLNLGGYGIAAWDGSVWSKPTTGAGLECANCAYVADIHSLALFDDGGGAGLYVGGDFELADGQRVNNVARLDAGGWSGLGASNAPAGRVRAFEVFDDGAGPMLYAGGAFGGAGAVRAPGIARFDGSQWSAVGGAGACDGEVRALTSYDDGSGPVLVAGGTFTQLDGVAAKQIARWNGSSWAEFGGGIVAAAGQPHVSDLAVFDGGSGPELYASGWFSSAGGSAAANIARWNGSTWLPLGAGVLGSPSALVVHDDGSGSSLFVGLASAAVNGSANIFGIARWNGANWSHVGGGLWDGSGARDLAVFDSGSGPELYAIGGFNKAGQLNVRGLARWNGTTWSDVGGGLTPVAFPMGAGTTLGVFDEGGAPTLFAAGFYDSSSTSGDVFHGVARWNGSAWSDVGGGLDGTASDMPAISNLTIVVDAIEAFGGRLYFGGAFTQAGSSASAYLARWEPDCNCAPTNYCTAGTTTNGCQAQMSSSGVPSASATSGFVLHASQVEGGKAGLIFYGVNGRNASQWGAGSSYLCLRAPIQRTQFHSTGGTTGQCDGALSVDWNAWVSSHPAALGVPFAVGQTVQGQAWFRDPPAPKSTSLSDAIEFYVCP